MTRHTLGPGREVIRALVALGAALDYTTVEEWRVPDTTAAVDVAWLRRAADHVPILMFEVESRPGDGVAVNAMKLLGKHAADLPKPLHLFHVVVGGGQRSARPVDVERTFAAHNYSVHLLSTDDEPAGLLSQVLSVHARIADRVDGVRLAEALRRKPWPAELVEPLLQHAETEGLRGLGEPAYVAMARRSAQFRPSLTRKLRALWAAQLAGAVEPPNRYDEDLHRRAGSYSSYMGTAACEALELGLLAALDPACGPRALVILERWQELNHIGDSKGPFTGGGTQWTQYVLEHGAFLWALVAALMRDVPGARAWCAAQPAAFLEDLNPDADGPLIAALAVWIMHLAAVPECEPTYARACARLDRCGGVNDRWLVAPHPGPPCDDGWEEVLPDGRGPQPVPVSEELVAMVRAKGHPAGDPVDLALGALLDDPVYRPGDGAAVAACLAADTPPAAS
jgi:hypothetical protein